MDWSASLTTGSDRFLDLLDELPQCVDSLLELFNLSMDFAEFKSNELLKGILLFLEVIDSGGQVLKRIGEVLNGEFVLGDFSLNLSQVILLGEGQNRHVQVVNIRANLLSVDAFKILLKLVDKCSQVSSLLAIGIPFGDVCV